VKRLLPTIENILGQKVAFDASDLCQECIPNNHPITLCENVRFYEGETSNDDAFAQLLAQRGDVFVNEAFSVSHRQHASVCGTAKYLDSYVGFSCARDWQNVQNMREKLSDAIAFVGGCKIQTKLPLVCKLLPDVQKLVLGALLGISLRDFLLCEQENESMREYAKITQKYMHKIIFPLDVRAYGQAIPFDKVINNEGVVDVGPLTEDLYKEEISLSRVLFMNGPVGQYEVAAGERGTHAIGDALFSQAERNHEFFALLGGGDTVAALMHQYQWPKNVIFSSSGGALLYAMTHGQLPALEAQKC